MSRSKGVFPDMRQIKKSYKLLKEGMNYYFRQLEVIMKYLKLVLAPTCLLLISIFMFINEKKMPGVLTSSLNKATEVYNLISTLNKSIEINH